MVGESAYVQYADFLVLASEREEERIAIPESGTWEATLLRAYFAEAKV